MSALAGFDVNAIVPGLDGPRGLSLVTEALLRRGREWSKQDAVRRELMERLCRRLRPVGIVLVLVVLAPTSTLEDVHQGGVGSEPGLSPCLGESAFAPLQLSAVTAILRACALRSRKAA